MGTKIQVKWGNFHQSSFDYEQFFIFFTRSSQKGVYTGYMEYLDLGEFVFAPLTILIILLIGVIIMQKMPKSDPLRQYFMKGLLVKLFGGLSLAVIYILYYKTGDTVAYYYRALLLKSFFFEDFMSYFKVLRIHAHDLKYIQCSFDINDVLFNHDSTLFVIKVASVLGWFSGHSFFGISALATFVSYSGVWKFFRFLTKLFPHLVPQLAIAVLYLPSIIFWGSGLLKDPFSFAALGWLVFSIHQLFVERKNKLGAIVAIIMASYVIIIVKIYIFATLVPGLIIWVLMTYRNKIKFRPEGYCLFPF